MSTSHVVQPIDTEIHANATPAIATRARLRRVLLVGAGNIAAVHAEVLHGMSGVRIAAIVDPNLAAAERLAERWGAPAAHRSVTEAICDGAGLDAAHILVPPDLHRDAALPLLEAGCPVLVEKPLATSRQACDDLLAAAHRSGAMLGVNQNFVFHPAFVQLRREVEAGTYGPPRFVDCIYNVPLRQLAARQFGHWMFHAPGNILLEQAVHPLSQIVALAGAVQEVRALAGPPPAIAPGVFPTTSAILTCARLPAQLRFAVGQAFPFWQLTVVCDDGVLVADMLANRCYAHGRTRWLEVVDGLVSGARTAGAILGGALRNTGDYALSSLRLRRRSDAVFRSMEGGIGAFHAALQSGVAPETDGAFGASLVRVCEKMRDAAYGAAAWAPCRPAVLGSTPNAAPADVAVLGGTGFIGTETVRRLLAGGARVSIMARSIRNLPDPFHDERVALHQGDIRDADAVRRVIGGARAVVNLAHGGGGGGYEQVRAAMVGGAETVAQACLASGVRRLVHVGSIASLYLGPQPGAVTGATGSDPRPQARGDYARAKATCDEMLLEMHARDGLPVCLLRPGLVVGEGASPFHSGLGVFNNEQHCVGWNRGRNPLPFVLVQDVVQAILLAARAGARVEGRCYNLVGDVRPSAQAYVADLATVTGRPLRFHPSLPGALWSQELAKWLVKCAGGRRTPLPSRHDILSRGLTATFDCSDAKRDLGWDPVADAAEFRRLAIEAHAG
jgi:predicted dehydrogenase/nucleoside-diphosphate-sugar epimerase